MDTIGIIVEYNPFHNGHLYMLNKVKEQYPYSKIVIILNGYFLERGLISYLVVILQILSLVLHFTYLTN